MDDKNDNRVNCFQCIHFSVTWEPDFPKACSLFGFKTKNLPSADVFESTNTVCMGFEKKTSDKSMNKK